ncbi:MAG: carbohydrate kinase [Nitrospinae bacterium]|nr:carbohydrate kinase [Nitrospinota bacterium]
MRFYSPLGPVLVFGEVLFDKFPDRTCLGGAPFNYAYHLHHMGIPVRFISRVGGDDPGKEILERLQEIGFSIEGIQMDIINPTGQMEVNLDDKGVPEFKILADRAFDYIEYDPSIEALAGEDIPLIYFGTLAQRHSTSAETLGKILQTVGSRSTMMMDINLRYPFYTPEVIRNSLQQCDILKINSEELVTVKKALNITSSANGLARHLLDTYKVGFVSVTKGDHGSELYEAGNRVPYRCSVLPPEEMVDTVGSGDAFSAMLTAGYLAGWPKQTMIEKATEFASKICEFRGALPPDLEFYKPYRFDG